jgi:hypothetical protein
MHLCRLRRLSATARYREVARNVNDVSLSWVVSCCKNCCEEDGTKPRYRHCIYYSDTVRNDCSERKGVRGEEQFRY